MAGDIRSIAFDEMLDLYDVFLVDQFGVLRDHVSAYDGAPAALRRLKEAGKTVVIFSNSGRSSAFNRTRLSGLGFPESSYDHFITSGDVAFDLMSKPASPVRSGMRCLTIPPDIEAPLAERLGLPKAEDGNDCDVMIISGSEATTDDMHDCRAVMEPAAARGVPCYCINPDTRKLVGERVSPGPGLLAELYEQLGGDVVWIGKPHREIYDRALGLVPGVQRRRVVCIGDSIEHDILGAQRAELDSVLVRTGVLAHEEPKAIQDMMDRLRAHPTFEMDRFASLPSDRTGDRLNLKTSWKPV